MIKLRNVSKYYHNEGIVTLALHKINLDFKAGEFVAITGESGSGKSTLLNVIAGIDSYEEGELFINGEETSYFDDDDWESYRKDKIAFIFQNYNLIDSYTVLKNVEVALVVQGLSKKERIEKAKEIIDKVGLTDHLKHRASKLSGGQKQRLAIARALAKETDIIVADEPTGNLDSVSGKQIVELLSEIAKQKLVFVVTHNYEQVANYVSRKIRLFDGEVIEDKSLRKINDVILNKEQPVQTKELTQALNIAKFNLFGQPKKTSFIFLVCFAIVTFIFFFYSLIITSPYTEGYYYSELNNYQERLIIKRKDKKDLNDEDFNYFNELQNSGKIDRIIKEDSVIDTFLRLNQNSGEYYIYFRGQVQFNITYTEDTLIGRFPEADDEILLNIYFNDNEESDVRRMLNTEMDFTFERDYFLGSSSTYTFKVVGINKRTVDTKDGYVVTDDTFKKIHLKNYYNNLGSTLQFFDDSNQMIGIFDVRVYVDYSLSDNQTIFNNVMFGEDYSYVLVKEELLDVIKKEGEGWDFASIYLSEEFITRKFPVKYSQYTLNLKNVNDRTSLEKELLNNGYYAFSPFYDVKVADYMDTFNAISSLFSSLGFVFIVFIIYLISYLIFKLIMNTKIKDYTILRIIGARKTLISWVIRSELLISFLLAYIVFFVFYFFIKDYYPFLVNLKILDYIVVFLINVGLSLLIARKFIVKQIQATLFTNLRAE